MLTVDERIAAVQAANRALSDDILAGYQTRNRHKVETSRRALQANADALHVMACESTEWCRVHLEYRCTKRRGHVRETSNA